MVGAGRGGGAAGAAARRRRGKSVADLCAAPGGKTAQLAAAGAEVTAVDLSSARLKRLSANLERLGLKAELVEADAGHLVAGRDCSTRCCSMRPAPRPAPSAAIPDILRLKRPEDVAALADVQARLLDNAAALVEAGRHAGLLHVLARARGRRSAGRALSGRANPALRARRSPPANAGTAAEWLTPEGDLRTLPYHLPNERPELSGMDGFFAARLVRRD